jgi:hypothetical protein
MKAFASIVAAVLLLAPSVRAEEPATEDKEVNEAVERARTAAEKAQAAAEEARKAAEEARKAAREFTKRFKTSVERVGKRNMARLTMDGVPLLQVPAIRIETRVEGEGENRSLVVRRDGKEISRVPLPHFNVKPWALPPMAFPNVDAVSTKVVSQTINGVSSTKVWVDGKLVYEGPGGGSHVSTSNVDGVKSVEVKVDGRVIYKACEGKGAPKKGEKRD